MKIGPNKSVEPTAAPHAVSEGASDVSEPGVSALVVVGGCGSPLRWARGVRTVFRISDHWERVPEFCPVRLEVPFVRVRKSILEDPLFR